MKLIADLQVHSRFSRATSSSLNIQNLEKYARLKGIDILGTGDITHPKWLSELKKELKEDGSGILTSSSGFKFVLQGEVSNVYTQNNKGRRIHNLILAPNFEAAENIQKALLKKGRIDYDGRPIFGFSCPELVEMMRSVDPKIEIIPAHCWTPWFGLFGSMSGFDSVKECFLDQTKYIHALETGLSSDPAMNWRLSQLDEYVLVSNSDAHSFWPWRLGREATVFDIKPAYDDLLKAIQTGKGIVETLEFFCEEGKYHYSGHRTCNVCLSPKEAAKLKDICPKCKQKITVGVAQRVEQLADREEGFRPKKAKPFRNLVSLSELIAGVIGSGVASKAVWAEYYKLIKEFKTEMNVLLEAEEADLKKITSEKIVKIILKNRDQQIKFRPGFDGEYGKLILDEKDRT